MLSRACSHFPQSPTSHQPPITKHSFPGSRLTAVPEPLYSRFVHRHSHRISLKARHSSAPEPKHSREPQQPEESRQSIRWWAMFLSSASVITACYRLIQAARTGEVYISGSGKEMGPPVYLGIACCVPIIFVIQCWAHRRAMSHYLPAWKFMAIPTAILSLTILGVPWSIDGAGIRVTADEWYGLSSVAIIRAWLLFDIAFFPRRLTRRIEILLPVLTFIAIVLTPGGLISWRQGAPPFLELGSALDSVLRWIAICFLLISFGMLRWGKADVSTQENRWDREL
jgi:hypothetical protein